MMLDLIESTRISLLPEGRKEARHPDDDAPPGEGKALAFKMEIQKNANWCWSAVSVSVARFYNAATDWTQCTLANAEFATSSCCPKGGNERCDQPWYLNYSLDRVGHLASVQESSLYFEAIVEEIDAGRPIGCWIKWPDGSGHFVVLDAYSTDYSTGQLVEWLSVQDSRYGHSDYPYQRFLFAYRKVGHWSASYLTRSN